MPDENCESKRHRRVKRPTAWTMGSKRGINQSIKIRVSNICVKLFSKISWKSIGIEDSRWEIVHKCCSRLVSIFKSTPPIPMHSHSSSPPPRLIRDKWHLLSLRWPFSLHLEQRWMAWIMDTTRTNDSLSKEHTEQRKYRLVRRILSWWSKRVYTSRLRIT